jgi:hypothetical protein
MQHHYNVDLCDFYRGTLSGRRLEVLIRHLPITSELVTAQNGGRRKWTQTEHLLADLWALTVRMNSPKGSLPDNFDHSTRAAATAEAKEKHMAALKRKYQQRKRRRGQTLNAVEAD